MEWQDSLHEIPFLHHTFFLKRKMLARHFFHVSLASDHPNIMTDKWVRSHCDKILWRRTMAKCSSVFVQAAVFRGGKATPWGICRRRACWCTSQKIEDNIRRFDSVWNPRNQIPMDSKYIHSQIKGTELVDWQGLKLPPAERRQRDSLKVLNAQSKCGKTGYVLRKNLQHLMKSCLQWNCYQPSTRNRVQIQWRKTQAKKSLDEER